jgi:hypothetical protein
MGGFLLTDCCQCDDPKISLNMCEFDCEKGVCDVCMQNNKQCPDCGRIGCSEHFDGMYCLECIKENGL